ncbi:MAG: 5-oxoprolinase [Gammaproteobacteria bacterium]|jgi:N-methylhydantoinase A|nr:5-oxoprolinase [Gammaproteobacteria bacterium]
MSLRIAIDTGGTFTDVVAINDDTGEQWAVKTPSTPNDPSIGLLEGMRKAAGQAGIPESDINQLLHGSTTATNAVLEHKFEGLGLLVTKGFRHIIEIARQSVPDGYGNSYFWVKPPRLVPLHLVREVRGRIDFQGKEIDALDEDAVLEGAEQLVSRGVKCIGVCLLHSYANDGHEKRVGEILKERYPDIFVSLSSLVLPEYREYERAMTTLIDVMVKPYCKTYLRHAEDQLRMQAGDAPFLIMQSNGGVVSAEAAGQKPVTMLLSGPAAGVLGATYMSHLAGHKDVLTLDVGGTSTDVSLVEDLNPQLTTHSLIEHYPVKTPMLDIATVGTGGGSLAWIDDYGSLKVGPRSAGADPGPICYSRGGKKPTVTDAALVLGRLPNALVGGELELDVEGARVAFSELGASFKISAEEAAAGVFEIAAANQVNGIRQVSVLKGRDPGLYALVAFGGAGGLFAAEVADFLNITTVLSPPNPGNLSAFGLHVSDIKRDYIRTIVRRQSESDNAEIQKVWSDLESQGRKEISEEGVEDSAIEAHYSADMRYVGEGHEVPVNVPQDLSKEDAVEFIWDEFHNVHDKTFGFQYRDQQDVELVNLRVQAVGRANRPEVLKVNKNSDKLIVNSTRSVFWREEGWLDCPIYTRANFPIGISIQGPAIFEEYGSTVVVPRNWSASKDEYGNLKLERIS